MGSKLNSIAFAILGILFFAGVANADSITYQVTGTMTFAHGETVTFSFESMYTAVTFADGSVVYELDGLVPGTTFASATGPFSTFTNLAGFLGPGYVGFDPTSGGISQFYTNTIPETFYGFSGPPSTPPQFIAGAYIWSCLTQACLDAFDPSFAIGEGGPIDIGTLESKTTLVTEPPSLLLVSLGAILFMLSGSARKYVSPLSVKV